MKRLLLLAFVLANVKAGATGVCLTCPTGFNCTDGIPVADSNARQVLVREGGKAVWKDVSTVTTLRGPQGSPGSTGPAGPQGDKGVPTCIINAAVTGGDTTIEGKCFANSSSPTGVGIGAFCWCRLRSQVNTSCYSSLVFRGNGPDGCHYDTNGFYYSCTSNCRENLSWLSSTVW